MQYTDTSGESMAAQYAQFINDRRASFLRRVAQMGFSLNPADRCYHPTRCDQQYVTKTLRQRRANGQLTGRTKTIRTAVPRPVGLRAQPRLQGWLTGTHEFLSDWELMCIGANLKAEFLVSDSTRKLPQTMPQIKARWTIACKQTWDALVAEIQLGGSRYKQANRMLERWRVYCEGYGNQHGLDWLQHQLWTEDNPPIAGTWWSDGMHDRLVCREGESEPLPQASVNGAAIDFSVCLRRHPELYHKAGVFTYGSGYLCLVMCP